MSLPKGGPPRILGSAWAGALKTLLPSAMWWIQAGRSACYAQNARAILLPMHYRPHTELRASNPSAPEADPAVRSSSVDPKLGHSSERVSHSVSFASHIALLVSHSAYFASRAVSQAKAELDKKRQDETVSEDSCRFAEQGPYAMPIFGSPCQGWTFREGGNDRGGETGPSRLMQDRPQSTMPAASDGGAGFA